MGRGGAVYLSYTAFVLLSAAPIVRAGLWTVDIDEGPAPSPEDGPPFSAHASRDSSLLPYQIIGIVGGYMSSVLIIGTLALTIGRRLRVRAQQMSTRPVEMVKPMPKSFDSAGTSPVAQKIWQRSHSKKSMASSVLSADSDATFDSPQHVRKVEEDRTQMGRDMEDIYAQVFQYEQQKYQGDTAGTLGLPQAQKSPIVAIYPPMAEDLSVAPAVKTMTGSPPTPAYSQHHSESAREHARDRAISFGSTRTADSSRTPGPRKLRKRLADIKIGGISGSMHHSPKISSPFQRFPAEECDDEAMTPLSATFIDPGPPPEPPTSRTIESQYAPSSPGTARTRDLDEYGDIEGHTPYTPRDFPRPNPQRPTIGYAYDNEAQRITDFASGRSPPTSPARSERQARSITATNTTGSLPLRQIYTGTQHSPTTPRSPEIRQTHIEYNRSRLPPRRDQYSAFRTPGNAPPLTPLETPLTGLATPHWTTRADRKQKEKEERAHRGIITEEERVPDDDDLWSSAY